MHHPPIAAVLSLVAAAALLPAQEPPSRPAQLANQLADLDGPELEAACAELSRSGAAAGIATRALLQRLRQSSTCHAVLLRTLADVVPYRPADTHVSSDEVRIGLLLASPLQRPVQSPVLGHALRRFERRLAASGPRPLDDLRRDAAGHDVLRAELAIERLGAPGAAAAPALFELSTLLHRPDPRLLGTTELLPLRQKAAIACLAITDSGPAAERARAVLAEANAPPAPSRPLPIRVRERIHAAIAELAADDTRNAAVANLIGFGAHAVAVLAEQLAKPDLDTAVCHGCLEALGAMGPGAAPATPQLFAALTERSSRDTAAILRTLAKVAPWSRDLVPALLYESAGNHVAILGTPIHGSIDATFLTEFRAALDLYHAAVQVDPYCAIDQLGAELRSDSVLRREHALRLVSRRGPECLPLLAEIGAMLEADQPAWPRMVVHDERRSGTQPTDRTQEVRSAAAAAILAIAPPDHPLHVKAKAILASR